MQGTYQNRERLYFLPIGGTAMASLAGLLHEAGHFVEGVDSQLYPPMSTLLDELGISVRLGFDPAALPDRIDRVVIGNAVPRSNPEVAAVLKRRLRFLSQAEAVAHYLLAEGRQAAVVAGTHGKTTTSAMLSWLLEDCDRDPSYLVGGLLQWSRRSFRLGQGPWMVLEGDEYNTAFFDRGPKFLHYRSQVFLLGPVEFDHGDIYRDLDAVLTAFRAGTAQVPKHGSVVVNANSEAALAACRDASAPLITVGRSSGCDLQIVDDRSGPDGSQARLLWRGANLEMSLPMVGGHNVDNAAMALAAAFFMETPVDRALAALARFPGVKRRLETVGEANGVTLIDDFAHHPTALAATLKAARQRWPRRRLVVAYEPRSLTSARAGLEGAYENALIAADLVLVAAPFHRGRLAAADLLDRKALKRALHGRGVESLMPAADEVPAEVLAPALTAGDVVIGCSSGDFGGFHQKLLTLLGNSSDE